MKKRIIVSLFVSLLAGSSACAETLDLQTAWEHARFYDAGIRVAAADNAMRQEETAKARAALRPAIQAQSSFGRNITNSNAFSSTQYYNTRSSSITLKQQVFDPGTEASYYKARAQAAQSSEQLRNETMNLMVRVAEAYFSLLYALDAVPVSRTRVEAAEELLKQQEYAFQKGIGTVTAVDEARANYDAALAEKIEAVNNASFSSHELERQTGIRDPEPVPLSCEAFRLDGPDPQDVGYWVNLARETSADIKAAEQGMEIARHELQKNKMARYPTVNLVAGRSYSLSETSYTIERAYDTYSVALQLEVPVYTGGYISASLRQAKAGSIKAGEEYTWHERQVIADIHKYYNGTLNAIAEVKAYEQAVASRIVSLKSVKKGLKNGLADKVEVLKAEEQLLLAELERSMARYRYIINLLMLKDTAGTINPSDLDEVNSWLHPR